MKSEQEYLYTRAESELKMAQRAACPEAVRAHYVLAGHYLDRLHGGDDRGNVTSIVSHKLRQRSNAR